jgi:hypothetical protein
MSILGRFVDERFLVHRQRSTSVAGIAGGVLAVLLFAYRFYIDHIFSWDLLAVSITFIAVKLSLMSWYYVTD